MESNTQKTRVVNIYKDLADIYIGRNLSNGFTHRWCELAEEEWQHFGNPWSHNLSANAILVKDRETAIDNCRRWLAGEFPDVEPKRRQWILDNLYKLKGKILGCFCKPKSCHGDILAELVNALP